MTATKLRAVATAFLLTTATAAAGVMLSSLPAAAQSVRPVVGKPLQEAQALAAQKNYKAAMVKIAEAEAAPNQTAQEIRITAEMKEYISSRPLQP